MTNIGLRNCYAIVYIILVPLLLLLIHRFQLMTQILMRNPFEISCRDTKIKYATIKTESQTASHSLCFSLNIVRKTIVKNWEFSTLSSLFCHLANYISLISVFRRPSSETNEQQQKNCNDNKITRNALFFSFLLSIE